MRGWQIGDGLPDITDGAAVIKSLRDGACILYCSVLVSCESFLLVAAGFEVIEYRDLAPESQIAWYEPFKAEYTLKVRLIGIVWASTRSVLLAGL